MRRYLVTVVVGLVQALLVAATATTLRPPWWALAAGATALVAVLWAGHRRPLVAFVVAQGAWVLTGQGHVLLLWAAYRTGRATLTRRGTAMAAGAALGGLGAGALVRSAEPDVVAQHVFGFVAFVALPMLVGRYLAQHERLVSTLDRENRHLRWRRDALAEQARLRERVRIARDMHDSLGHRLSLVSVQAAALEVGPLPPAQRAAVTQLAASARAAMAELNEVVATLRTGEDAPAPGIGAVDGLVDRFRAAGQPVTRRDAGPPRALPDGASHAAYRVVEEGLTNVAKHAPGSPVTVSLTWEPDALLVTVANPVPPGPPAGGATGHGIAGLAERVGAAGGVLDHRRDGGEFRLFAMLPGDVEVDEPEVSSGRGLVVGVVAAALMLLLLPAGMMVGVGG
ncbi:hypothetical protein GCM10009682_39620 [Luedemannella flava]|uniref:histidine kinase n=1 Tax=Luedemannella flava TaxID=349316 RepID=A0ABN2M975_9ACTN